MDGNCSFIAEQLKTLLDADIIRLELQKEKQRSFMGKMFWGGGMVSFGIKPALKPYTFNPSAYDLIVIGAPVWAWSPAPPLRTFLKKTSVTGKKIALFICHGGGPKKAMDKFRAFLAGNDICAEIDFKNAGNAPEETKQKIAAWVKQLK